ncbi:hypothetical protein A2U01_0081263, partial [Trifolium medium]|nr:hypothetical protein [Trifolium medium]
MRAAQVTPARSASNRTTPIPAARCANYPRALRKNQKKTQETEKHGALRHT